MHGHASGLIGCGALDVSANCWIQLKWPQRGIADGLQLREESISFKELLPIVLACAVWAEEFQGLRVIVHTGAVDLVNSGYSKVAQIMHLLRCLFFVRAQFQIEVWAVSGAYAPGSIYPGGGECFSRCYLTRQFISPILSGSGLTPGAITKPPPPPPLPLPLLSSQNLDWTSPDWTRRFSSCFWLD